MADAGDEADQYPLTLVPGPPTPAAQLLPGSPSEATPPSDQSPPAQPPLEERTNVGTEGSAGSDTDMADVDAAYTDPAPGAADHGGGQNDDSKFVPEIGKLFVWKEWIGEVVGDAEGLPEPNRALRNVQWYREDSDGVTIEPKPKNQAFKGGGDAVRGWEYIVDEEAQDLRNQIDAARAAQARPPRSTALHTPPSLPSLRDLSSSALPRSLYSLSLARHPPPPSPLQPPMYQGGGAQDGSSSDTTFTRSGRIAGNGRGSPSGSNGGRAGKGRGGKTAKTKPGAAVKAHAGVHLPHCD